MRLSPEEPARVLASGIDSLNLAMDVQWLDESVFKKLTLLKSIAELHGEACPGKIEPADGSAVWLFTVQPYGSKGYAWLLESAQWSMQIGNWLSPKSRPSIMTNIRSETLWHHGPRRCVEQIINLIQSSNGHVVACKPSRVDVCADVLLPESLWQDTLREAAVTRANKSAPYFDRDRLTGIVFGRGAVMCRLYDKPLEITQQSHKVWMYDLWKIESVADDHRIIRVEFQLRREALKEFGIETFDDLEQQLPRLWAYCTQDWLRLVDDPAKHHTQQAVQSWWSVVQQAVPDAATGCPAVRVKAIHQDKRQLQQMAMGFIEALTALGYGDTLIPKDESLDKTSHVLKVVNDLLRDHRATDAQFTENIKRKQAKYARSQEKFIHASGARVTSALSLKRSRHKGGKS